MKIVNLTQGTPEWHAHRAAHFNSSDAPVMMGASKHKTRSELIEEIVTGISPEISPALQDLFDRGHATEAGARPIVEALIGDELYPIVGVSEFDERFSASYDGATMSIEIGFEHKMWNQALVEKVLDGSFVDDPHYYWQLEHQLYTSDGAMKRIIFTVSDGTPDRFVTGVYTAQPGRLKELIAGWNQFEADVAERRKNGPAKTQALAIATQIDALPRISYRLDGLTLVSNLAEYRRAAEELVERSKLPLENDQDFADCEAMCKLFKDAEAAIKHMQEQVIGEIKDIDRFHRELGDIGKLINRARLNGEGQVKTRKAEIKAARIDAAVAKLDAHVEALNDRLRGRVKMPCIRGDFAGVIKGRSSLAKIDDAIDTELARAKIMANEIADSIEANIRFIECSAPDYWFLFADIGTLVHKAQEDFQAVVKNRVADHIAAEERRKEAASQPAAPSASETVKAAAVSATASVIADNNVQPIRKPSKGDIIRLVAGQYLVSIEQAAKWLDEAFGGSDGAIQMTEVDSSQIHAIGHDPKTDTLAIQFKGRNGPAATYHYKNFTAAQFEEFKNAESIGAYFGANIKPATTAHPYQRVSG